MGHRVLPHPPVNLSRLREVYSGVAPVVAGSIPSGDTLESTGNPESTGN